MERDASAGVAVVVVGDDHPADVGVIAGVDPLDDTSKFEIASISKTMTALVLAQLVLSGQVELSTPLGEVMDAGPNSSITLRELATHSSGLPRLPGNLVSNAELDPDDPYASYTTSDLVEALHLDRAGGKTPEYSNYGYMVLAHSLTAATGRPFAELLTSLVLEPLGMTSATTAQPSEVEHLVPGYRDGTRVPHWTKIVPGPGGVIASISDLTSYLQAQLRPEATDLEIAIEMTQAVGSDGECLGWQRYGPVHWHNGGSGGFSTFAGFDRQAQRGVAILVNSGTTNASVDRAGFVSLGITDPLIDS